MLRHAAHYMIYALLLPAVMFIKANYLKIHLVVMLFGGDGREFVSSLSL